MNEIPGEYLTANPELASLSGVASKYPTLYWTALIVVVVFCVGYGIYYLVKRKKK